MQAYRDRNVPLDVFIFDMNWHFKFGWGAYTWDSNNFPVPSTVMQYLQKEQNLLVGANLHDESGVVKEEARYDAFRNAVGWSSNTKTIPFLSCSNVTFAFALEDVVVSPLGFDVPWIDWQQGGDKGGCTDGTHNPTIVLNRLRATANLRTGSSTRGMAFGRWGGLGNHRFPTGFSGDVLVVSWKDLAFQPYFSITASNVQFAWSHDILGPHQLPVNKDHELQLRWIQWGAFSSIFRTHDRGMAEGTCYDFDVCANVEVFDLPRLYFDAARKAMIERSRLLPYIYSATRELFDTGVSLLRPMYYEFPEEELAYGTDASGSFAQYFFGPNMLVAPIVSKSSDVSGLSKKKIWLPPGCLIEVEFGTLFCSNGTVVNREYALTEVPRFVFANRLLIKSRNAGFEQLSLLEVEVFPNLMLAGQSTFPLYEDDGRTTDYLDRFSFTNFSLSVTAASGEVSLIVRPPSGAFSPLPKTLVFRIFNYPLPSNVSSSVPVSWNYDASSMSLVIHVLSPVSSEFQLTVTPSPSSLNVLKLIPGMAGKIRRAQMAKEQLDHVWQTPGALVEQKSYLSAVATFPDVLSTSTPEEFVNLVDSFEGLWSKALDQVEKLVFDPLAIKTWRFAFALMKSV